MQDTSVSIDLGEGAFLRLLHPGDVSDDYVAALNDPAVNQNMVVGVQYRETHETVRAYIEENLQSNNSLLFGLFMSEGTLVGTSRLHGMEEGSLWMGVLLFTSEWRGKGWGARVVRAVSDYALAEFNTGIIRAGIYQRNEISRKCFSNAGFVHEKDDDTYKGPTREIWAKRTEGNCSCI